MIPVTQTTLYDPDDDTRGNCIAACIASIFETDIDHIDLRGGPTWHDIWDWTEKYMPDLKFFNQDYGTNYRVEDGVWKYDFPEPDTVKHPPGFEDDYWILSAESPRIILQSGEFKGMPGLHAVVMKGNDIVWDPHPNAKEEGQQVGRWVQRSWWVPANLYEVTLRKL